jgi:hypothetical protein
MQQLSEGIVVVVCCAGQVLKKSRGCVGSVLVNGPPSYSAAEAALEKLIIISTVI